MRPLVNGMNALVMNAVTGYEARMRVWIRTLLIANLGLGYASSLNHRQPGNSAFADLQIVPRVVAISVDGTVELRWMTYRERPASKGEKPESCHLTVVAPSCKLRSHGMDAIFCEYGGKLSRCD